MKILHIVPSYLPAYRYGGPILSVHTLNKWLVKLGVSVTVYTTNIDVKRTLSVPTEKEIDIDGVKVFYFPISFRPWEYSLSMHRAIKRHIREFDLIHITSVFLSASVLGAKHARKNKKPYIISPRGSLMKEPLEIKSALLKRIYIKLIEKRNLAGASGVHFTTEKEKEEYVARGLPFKKAFLIPNSYDLPKSYKEQVDIREKLSIPKEKKIILSIGRINWKKGFDTLIPAFSEVLKRYPDTILIIAGEDDGGYEKKVRKLILENNLKIGENVIFTGLVLNTGKHSLIKESDVFVLPSYSENFGMSVIESMILGVPVVISENVGIAQGLKEKNAGIVVKKDTLEFTKAISKILSDDNFSKILGENGKKYAEENFSPERIANNFIKVYKEIIDS